MSDLAKQLFIQAWARNNHASRTSVEALARDACEAAEVFEAVYQEHWRARAEKRGRVPRPTPTSVPAGPVTSASAPLGLVDWVRGR